MEEKDKIYNYFKEHYDIKETNKKLIMSLHSYNGITMVIELDKDKDFTTQLENYIDNFDIDKEILKHIKETTKPREIVRFMESFICDLKEDLWKAKTGRENIIDEGIVEGCPRIMVEKYKLDILDWLRPMTEDDFDYFCYNGQLQLDIINDLYENLDKEYIRITFNDFGSGIAWAETTIGDILCRHKEVASLRPYYEEYKKYKENRHETLVSFNEFKECIFENYLYSVGIKYKLENINDDEIKVIYKERG